MSEVKTSGRGKRTATGPKLSTSTTEDRYPGEMEGGWRERGRGVQKLRAEIGPSGNRAAVFSWRAAAAVNPSHLTNKSHPLEPICTRSVLRDALLPPPPLPCTEFTDRDYLHHTTFTSIKILPGSCVASTRTQGMEAGEDKTPVGGTGRAERRKGAEQLEHGSINQRSTHTRTLIRRRQKNAKGLKKNRNGREK